MILKDGDNLYYAAHFLVWQLMNEPSFITGSNQTTLEAFQALQEALGRYQRQSEEAYRLAQRVDKSTDRWV